MRRMRTIVAVAAVGAMSVGVLGAPPAVAVTTVASANGQPWDIEDLGSDDDGSVEDGGQDAFDGFGGLRIQVLDATDAVWSGTSRGTASGSPTTVPGRSRPPRP
jgi:hypothetical protein